ncbi:cellulose biosynthesis cyclic di-GMP-binding regulatory protein BcsB, partial [Salmonella enterica subsp. enterica serovar Anatum]|nr:cellulose biosynthesis cyclic di-GMP-binding regulatory protein BcsB [Salmonella enterica subsp. enterica serovar Anatum]
MVRPRPIISGIRPPARTSSISTSDNAPVIEMMSHPDNPYVKLLVVFGRDDKDLLQAAKGIAQGNIL